VLIPLCIGEGADEQERRNGGVSLPSIPKCLELTAQFCVLNPDSSGLLLSNVRPLALLAAVLVAPAKLQTQIGRILAVAGS
jgi:hypothetical protein